MLRASGSGVVVAVLATVAFVFITGYLAPPFSLLVAPLFAAALAGLCLDRTAEAAVVGAIAGGVGTLLGSRLFEAKAYVLAVMALPAYAKADAQDFFYVQDLFRLMRSNPLAGPTLSGANVAITVLLAAALVGALAAAVSAGARSTARDAVRQAIGYVAVAALAVGLLATAPALSGFMVGDPGATPRPGSYAYDGDIFLATYSRMLAGEGYYRALVDAAAGDRRLQEQGAVKNGLFYGWAVSPVSVREPYLFWFFRLVSPGGGRGVTALALALSAVALFGAYWALRPRIGDRALFVPALLFPYLLLSVTWDNVFLPDFWAGLSVLFAALFLVRERYMAATAAVLLAALCREVMAVWLVVTVGATSVAFLRHRADASLGRLAASAAVALAGFAAAFSLHVALASRIVAVDPGAGRASLSAMLARTAGASFATKLLAPVSYLALPYRFLGLVPLWVPIAALGGYLWALRDVPRARLMGAGFAAFWLIYYVTLGATSSYWGLHTMPVFLLGAGALLADLDGVVLSSLGFTSHTSVERA